MLFLYRLCLSGYGMLIHLAAPFHIKARLFIQGRNHVFEQLERAMKGRKGKLVWFHVASLGEFEQGRPVMEHLQHTEPDLYILLTFFSPSGYEVKRADAPADYVSYLPLDSPNSARSFVQLTQPDLAIFVKYEFWYFYLRQLTRQQVPVFFISAIFRPGQWFFKPWGHFLLCVLRKVEHYFVQDERSKILLQSRGIPNSTVTGDTRTDRVLVIADSGAEIPLIDQFRSAERTIVLGSIWPSDMRILEGFIRNHLEELKFVIVPHRSAPEEIQEMGRLPRSITYSRAGKTDLRSMRILIIDQVGLLSRIYRYGEFAYVGGGFRGALHNTAEAAVHGVPVFFGAHPRNKKFVEAIKLTEAGGAFAIRSGEELERIYQRLTGSQEDYERAAEASSQTIRSAGGATEKIMKGIMKYL